MQNTTTLTPLALKDAPALIETVFPAQKVSFEAQSERKAVAAQTLTGLGSYWKGRKPLILVRAIVLGSLLPPTDDAEADLAIFEKLMAFDDEGLRRTLEAADAAFALVTSRFDLVIRLTSFRQIRGQAAFEAVYRELYERLGPPVPVEIMNWRVTAAGPEPDLQLAVRADNASTNAADDCQAVEQQIYGYGTVALLLSLTPLRRAAPGYFARAQALLQGSPRSVPRAENSTWKS